MIFRLGDLTFILIFRSVTLTVVKAAHTSMVYTVIGVHDPCPMS